MKLKGMYSRSLAVLFIVLMANISIGSIGYYIGDELVPDPVLSSEYETLAYYYGDGSHYYETKVDGTDYISLDGAVPSALLEIVKESDSVYVLAGEEKSFKDDSYGVTYEISFDETNFEVNVDVNGDYGSETYEDLDEGDFIKYPSDWEQPIFVMKYVEMTGSYPYRFESEDIVLIADGLFTRPVKKCVFDGQYTPTSIPYEYSDFGEYAGISETHDNETYVSFVGYKNIPLTDINSGDSLVSRNWTAPILIGDFDKKTAVFTGSSVILDEGYEFNFVEVDTNNEKLLVTLNKNGVELDSDILEAGEIYTYRSTISCDGSSITDFPVILIHIDEIFRGTESNAAFIEGVFQISESAQEVNLIPPISAPDSWSISISAPNSIQDVTIGVDPATTESLDVADSWSLPPYPMDKVFLLIDGYFSKNIKQSDNGASWDFKVRVPSGQTTALTWDSSSVPGVNIRIFDGTSEIYSGQNISAGLHDMEIYAVYGDDLDLHPAISIDRPASVSRSFTLSGTVADDNLNSLAYSVNGNSNYLSYVQDGSIYTFNQTLDLEDGDYVVEVEATDSASTSKSVSFNIDNTIPDVNVTVLPYNQNVKISISAIDINKLSMMECTISDTGYVDGSKWFIRNSKSFDESFKFRDLDVGSYTVKVHVEDCVGNIATVFENFEIVDNYPPEITINFPEDGVYYTYLPQIDVSLSEEASLIYSLNGHNETDRSQIEQYFVEGQNTFTVYATDLYGNTASETITFNIDANVLDTSVTPTNLNYNQGNFFVNWEWMPGNDTDSFNISLNNAWYNGTSNTYINDTSLLPHGNSSIKVYGYNDTSSILSNPLSSSVQLDNNPITITGLFDVFITEGDTVYIDANYTDMDGDIAIFSCNKTNLFTNLDASSGVGSWTTTIGDTGTHNILFTVDDGYGSNDSVVVTISVNEFITAPPANGSGTELDPYQIYDIYDLQAMKNDLSGHYTLMNDIDASTTSSWNNGGGFISIGPDLDTRFAGTLDGRYYSINNIFINNSSAFSNGLIGCFGPGTIKNIKILNASVIGHNNVGMVVGVSHAGNLENVYASGTIVGNSYCGGIFGGADLSTSSSNCGSNVTIYGNQVIGGHAGYFSGTNSNCYASGTIYGTSYIGGFVGLEYDSNFTNSYSTTTIIPSSGSGIGGFASSSVNSTFNSCYWDIETSGVTTSGGGIGKTTAEMQNQSTFTGWDFNDTWVMQDYPKLQVELQDVTPPEITIVSPENGVVYSSLPDINVTVSEEATLIYGLNGHNETNISLVAQHAIVGHNNFTVYATDLQGNTAVTEIALYVTGWMIVEHENLVDASSTTVSWEACIDDGLDDIIYEVRVGSLSGASDVHAESGISGTSSSSFSVDSGTYYWSVRSYDGYEYTDWSIEDVFVVTSGFADGSGTETDPWQISTVEELQAMSDDTTYVDDYFVLVNDIDASKTIDWNNGKGFSPIRPGSHFQGTLDGKGYTISNLYINRGSDGQVGMFPILANAEITNFVMDNASVTGSIRVGIVSGLCIGTADISHIHVTGTVTCTDQVVGGIAGQLDSNTSVNHCSSDAIITAAGFTSGGIVGLNFGAVENCWSASEIVLNGFWGGGLVANNYGFVNYSYSYGHVESDTFCGGAVGASSGIITSCFYNNETTEQSDTGKGTGITTAEMQNQSTFVGWDFNDTWEMQGYPVFQGELQNDSAAAFYANVTSGTMPLSVQFTDTTTNNPISWSWDFGDGSASTLQNPTHVYSDIGEFTVTLSTFDGTGYAFLTKPGYINVINETEPATTSGFSGTFETIYSEEDIAGNTLDIPDGTYAFNLSMDSYIAGNGEIVTGNLSTYPEYDDIELLLEFASSGDVSDTSVNDFTVTSSGVTWVETEYGYKPYFDGTNDYMQVPDNANLDLDTNFSLTMRYNISSVDWYYTPLFAKMGYYEGYELHHNNADKLLFRYGDDQNDLKSTGGLSGVVSLNEWNFITVTFNDGIITRMVDGNIVSTSDYSSAPILSDSSRALSIFRNINNALYTEGYLDMAVIHDTVLSLDDHRTLMNGFSGTAIKATEDANWTVYEGSTLSFAEDTYSELDIRSSGNGSSNITLSRYAHENVSVSETVNGNMLTANITHNASMACTSGTITYELFNTGYGNNLVLDSNNVNAVASLSNGVITIDTGSVVSGTEYYYNIVLSESQSSTTSGFSGTFETVYSNEDISNNTLDIPDGTYAFNLSMDNYIAGTGTIVTGNLSSYPEYDDIELLLEFASSGDTSDTSVNDFTVTSSGVTWVETEYGYKPYFDGTNDYMEIPDNANLDFDTNFSLTMRYNMTSADQYYNPLFAKMGYYEGYELHQTSSDSILFRYGDDANVVQTAWGDHGSSLNEWHFITVTFNDGIITRMIDGELGYVSDFSADPDVSNSVRTLSIFRNINNALYTEGYLDMAIIHDTVLSLEDHRALMNGFSGTAVKSSGDSNWTIYEGSTLSFDESAYTELDISSSGNGSSNITLSRSASEDIGVSETINGNELSVNITHTPAASYSDGSIVYELSNSGYVNNLALSSNNVNAVASIENGVITIDTGSVVSGTEYYYDVSLFATG